MLKRARAQARVERSSKTNEDLSQKEGGQELRRYLLERFCMEGMPGSEVATLSRLITRAGGLGVEDLALGPASATKNGHKHVRKKAGKIFPDVDVHYVDCPIHLKREARRTSAQIPIYLPSKAFQKFITEKMIRDHPPADFARVIGEIDLYVNHPVVLGAQAEGLKTPVRPVALYWDGVVYTKNDSFFAFYVTDILTTQKCCSFLLRLSLSCPAVMFHQLASNEYPNKTNSLLPR